MRQRVIVLETNRAGNGLRLGRYARQVGWDPLFLTDNLAKYDADSLTAVFNGGIAERNYWDLNATHSWFLEVSPKRIISFDDFHLLIANAHAEILGIESNSLRSLFLCLNKAACREHLAKCLACSSPAFAIISADSEVPDRPFTAYPAILKPAMESGSLAVTTVSSNAELATKISVVRSHIAGSITSVRQPLVLEKRISGREFSVELFADRKGKWHSIGICETLVGNNFVEIGHTLPADLSPAETSLLSEAACQIAQAVGLTSGLAHIEFKLFDGCAWLLEINARNAGDFIPALYDLVYGQFLLEEALLNGTTRTSNPACAAHVRFVIPPKNATVTQISFPQHPAIIEARSAPMPITTGESMRSNDDRLGHFIVVARHATEAQSLASELANDIRIEAS